LLKFHKKFRNTTIFTDDFYRLPSPPGNAKLLIYSKKIAVVVVVVAACFTPPTVAKL
jgi:hypothetical protein